MVTEVNQLWSREIICRHLRKYLTLYIYSPETTSNMIFLQMLIGVYFHFCCRFSSFVVIKNEIKLYFRTMRTFLIRKYAQ